MMRWGLFTALPLSSTFKDQTIRLKAGEGWRSAVVFDCITFHFDLSISFCIFNTVLTLPANQRIRILPVFPIALLGLALKVPKGALKHQFHNGIAQSPCRLIWKLSKSPCCSCCLCLITAHVRTRSSACWCFCWSWDCNCYSCIWNIHIPS